MEQVRKNKYSRGERVQRGSMTFTPRPVPTPVKPFNRYQYCFAVQHVQGSTLDSDPYRKYIMISGQFPDSDWAGRVKCPDGSILRFETVDQLEYGPGIQYIVLRLKTKNNQMEALAVADYSKVPKGFVQRCLAVIDDERVEQIAWGDLIDFTVEEEPFQAFAKKEEE